MAQIDWHDFVVVETIEPSAWTFACAQGAHQGRRTEKVLVRFTAEDENLQLVPSSARGMKFDVASMLLHAIKQAAPIDPSTHAPKGAPAPLEQAGSNPGRPSPRHV